MKGLVHYDTKLSSLYFILQIMGKHWEILGSGVIWLDLCLKATLLAASERTDGGRGDDLQSDNLTGY